MNAVQTMYLVMNAKQMVMLGVAALALLSTPAAQAFYNPHTGRWLSRDPIEESGFRTSALERHLRKGVGRYGSDQELPEEIGLYLFAANRPLNSLDYLGLTIRYWQIMWATKHPGCACTKAAQSQATIYDETKNRYGTIEDNTVANAIMHCSWMCWVSSLKGCGKEAASELGLAHELDHPANPEHDRAMDFFNNEIGLNIGGNSLQDCFDKCYSAAWAHQLYWYKPLESPQNWGLPSDFPDFNINSAGMATTPSSGGGSDIPPELLNR